MPPPYSLQPRWEDAANPGTRNWLSEKEHFAFAWNIATYLWSVTCDSISK